ncbi:SufE family protein [Paludibacter sp. 221]|uniref:SufE family protein n=1 Tax=Paludibacter sp. 221 TaxID=2302939 RepID=UPI0013CF9595|nr:SufE family protein [Paludibacter sp. 221]
MKTKLRENQDSFIREMDELDTWQNRFNYMIELSDKLGLVCPPELLQHPIRNCQSRSYFKAKIVDGILHVNGWSNASVMRGMIYCVIAIFDGLPINECLAEIDFHIKSDLINNLTPLRQAGLLEIIHRIIVLLPENVLK